MRENIPIFVVIESDILLDTRLTSTDKILYAVICTLSTNKEHSCFANSEYLCRLLNIHERQLRNCLQHLSKYKYISIKFIKNRRYIKPTINKFLQIRSQRSRNIEQGSIFTDYNWLEDNDYMEE